MNYEEEIKTLKVDKDKMKAVMNDMVHNEKVVQDKLNELTNNHNELVKFVNDLEIDEVDDAADDKADDKKDDKKE